MARKDVDLVIRARNEASKAIDSVGAALASLTKQEADTSKGAERVQSTLSALGKALGDLSKATQGATASQKLATTLAQATTELQRLDTEAARAQAEQARLAAELDKTAAAAARLRQETQASGEALTKQTAALEKTTSYQASLAAEINRATASRERLRNADARMVETLDKQQAAVDAARSRYNALAEQVANVAEPTATLQKRLAAAETALEKQEARLTKTVEAYTKNRAAIEGVSSDLATLSTFYDKASASIADQGKRINEGKESYASLKTATSEAAKAQVALQASATKAAETSSRQQEAADRARVSVQGMSAASAEAATEIGRLAQVGGAQLYRAFLEARREVENVRKAMNDANATAQALGRQMAATEEPSKELSAAFDKARIASRQAKAEFIAQLDALQKLRALPSFQVGPQQDPLGSLSKSQAAFAQNRAELQNTIAVAREAAAATAAVGQAGQQSAAGLSGVARGSKEAATASKEGADGTNAWAQAFRNWYGEGRTAMSLTQRLRGEVLSLVAAYVGFQAAIGLITKVIGAQRELEQATNRLNVAFSGNKATVGQELDFIRRQANRLGIEFGTLAGQYSQFAVATQGTNLAGEKTRKIFTAVAEAAKVNGTSLDDMKGIFLALTQMVSKGSVQMEELRGQLGERLPGALQIFADGMGISTAQLTKMMEQGQVSSDNLDKFADALNKKFGSQLQDSLAGTNAQIGYFQANIFNALQTIGKGGATEGFTKFLSDLNVYLRSADAESFFKRMGAAIEFVFDVLRVLLANIKLVAAALGLMIGFKAAPFFVAIRASIISLIATMKALPATAAAASASVNAMGTAAGASVGTVGLLRTALVGLRVAITGVLSATGIGLVITAIGAALGYLLSKADETTVGLNAHNKTVDAVKDAYDRFKDKPKELAEALSKVSKTQAELGLMGAVKALQDIRNETKTPLSLGERFFGADEVKKQLDDLVTAFKNGSLAPEDFKKKVDELAQANPQLDRNLVKPLLDAADKASDAQREIERAKAVIAVLSGTATEAQKQLLGLSAAFANTGRTTGDGKKQLDAYYESLEKIMALVPSLAAELKKMQALKTLSEEGGKAFAAAIATGDFEKIRTALNNVGAARIAINEQFANDAIKGVADKAKISLDTLKLIIGKEGYRSEAYQDVGGKPTIGFGNTMLHGRPVQMGDTVTESEAYQIMAEAVATFAAKIDAQVKVPITESMRNALISYAYNVGSVSKNILEKLNDRDYSGAQEAIRNGVATVNGQPNAALRERRGKEADLFGKEGLEGSYETQKAIVEEQEKKAEKEKEYHEQLGENLDLQKQEAEAKKAGTLEAQTELNIAKERAKAQKAGTDLRDDEIAKIKERTKLEWESKHANDETNQSKKDMAAADKVVNDLMAARNQLIALYKNQIKNGDTTGAEETKSKLQGVNTELQTAIDKAIQMHKAIGGPGADAAIAKLEAMKQTSAQVAQTIWVDWNKVGTTFASTLTNAFDTFASEVAKGTKVGEAARIAFLKFASDFLKQIAHMILQQAILNALKAAFPSFTGAGGLTGMAQGVGTAGVAHEGGVVGSLTRSRSVDPAIFIGAKRFHTGGFPGLAANEIPAILQKGEEVLTRADPRNRLNGGVGVPMAAGAAAGGAKTTIINAIDGASLVEQALGTRAGEKVILNWMQANKGAVKNAIGG